MTCQDPSSAKDADAPSDATASSDGPLSGAPPSLLECVALLLVEQRQSNHLMLAILGEMKSILLQNGALIESLAQESQDEAEPDSYLDGSPIRS